MINILLTVVSGILLGRLIGVLVDKLATKLVNPLRCLLSGHYYHTSYRWAMRSDVFLRTLRKLNFDASIGIGPLVDIWQEKICWRCNKVLSMSSRVENEITKQGDCT